MTGGKVPLPRLTSFLAFLSQYAAVWACRVGESDTRSVGMTGGVFQNDNVK